MLYFTTYPINGKGQSDRVLSLFSKWANHFRKYHVILGSFAGQIWSIFIKLAELLFVFCIH